MSSPADTETPIAEVVQPTAVVNAPRSPERRMTAWIGKSVFIKGDVVSAENLIVEGRVEGSISLTGHRLTIGVGADIHGDLTAQTIVVEGAVTGSVRAMQRVEVPATGTVEGDIRAPRLAVADGAVLHGHIESDGVAPPRQ